MEKQVNSFITSHNIVNRVYDMTFYFGIIKNPENEKVIKKYIRENLLKDDYVESLAKYFEKKQNDHYKNIELRCNLKDLIDDLNYLKQYLT